MKSGNSGILDIIHPGHRISGNSGHGNNRHLPYRDDELFNVLAENAGDLVFRVSFKPSFHYDFVSPSSTYITGYTPEEFYAYPHLPEKCIPPDDYALITDPKTNNSTKKGAPVDIRWIRKDGRIIWTEHLMTLVRDEQGKPESGLIIVRDITERKKAEEQLRQSEEFSSSLMKSSAVPILVVNADTSMKYVNPAFEKLTGFTAEEIIGKKAPYPWWREDMQSGIVNELKRDIHTGARRLEKLFWKKNGDGFWVEITSSPVKRDGEFQYSLENWLDITERKKAEEALIESETKYRSIFESANDIIMLLDQKGKIIDINSKVKEIAGYETEELIGRNFKDLNDIIPESSLATIMANFKKRLAGKMIPPYEVEIFDKNGGILYFELSAMSSKVNEKIMGTLTILRNITLKKRNILAIKESEEKFSKAFHSSPMMIAITTVNEGKFIDVNDNYTRCTGYSREELIGNTSIGIHHWANIDDRARMLQIFNEQGSVRDAEFDFRMKSGEIRTWRLSLEPITIGGELCLIGVSLDITERKQAEEKLWQSEEFNSSLMKSSAVPILVVNPDTSMKYVNPAFEKLTGFTAEEIIGKKAPYPWWREDMQSGIVNELKRDIYTGARRLEKLFWKKNGEGFWVEITSSPVKRDGEFQYSLENWLDITERKQVEETLRESEEKFSKAFHASPFSMCINRLSDGKFIEFNERFLRDKGYTRAELLGHNCRDARIWANHELASKLMETLKAGGQVHNQQMLFRTKSGHIRTGLLSADIINIKNEPCMLVINNDITQQKLAEEQLRLLSSVTEQVTDSIIITDPNFKITYMNKAAQKLFGYTIEEARGQGLDLFNAAPIPQDAFQHFIDTLSSGKVWSGVSTNKHKNGKTFICEIRMSPLYDEKGQICAYIDVQRDVTRQKEVEAKLQEHKKLIDSILATMTEGVLVIDNKDQIILANKAFFHIFHLNRKAAANMSLNEILPVDKFFDLHKAVKSGDKENNTLEFRYQVQDMEKIIYCIIVKMDGNACCLLSPMSPGKEKRKKSFTSPTASHHSEKWPPVSPTS